MDKKTIIGVSTLAVGLLILGSQTNVVGYQTVQASQQNLLRERLNQKDMLLQTICDLVNNKEIQKAILNSHPEFLYPSTMSLPIKIPTITKRQLEFACRTGFLLSKTIYPSHLQALGRHFHFPVDSKEISALVEKNPRLKDEMNQLSCVQCNCGFSNFTWRFPLLCYLVLLPLYIFCVTIVENYISTDEFPKLSLVCFFIAAVIWILVYDVGIFPCSWMYLLGV